MMAKDFSDVMLLFLIILLVEFDLRYNPALPAGIESWLAKLISSSVPLAEMIFSQISLLAEF